MHFVYQAEHQEKVHWSVQTKQKSYLSKYYSGLTSLLGQKLCYKFQRKIKLNGSAGHFFKCCHHHIVPQSYVYSGSHVVSYYNCSFLANLLL
jgi:hypothetical protein